MPRPAEDHHSQPHPGPRRTHGPRVLLSERFPIQIGVLFPNERTRLLKRRGDVVWKAQLPSGPVYILLEFQSRVDQSMPIRFPGYGGLLLAEAEPEEAAAGKTLGCSGLRFGAI